MKERKTVYRTGGFAQYEGERDCLLEQAAWPNMKERETVYRTGGLAQYEGERDCLKNRRPSPI